MGQLSDNFIRNNLVFKMGVRDGEARGEARC